MKNLVFFVSFLCFTSCAVHSGMISSTSNSKNVKYVDIAYGISQTNAVFGIGGLSQDALVMEGKNELIRNRPLKRNEEYSNFTVDMKRTYFPFYVKTKVTVSADVINFNIDTLTNPYSETYLQKLLHKDLSDSLFCIGDSIINKKEKPGVILSIVDESKVRIMYSNKNLNKKTKKVKTKKIYTTKKPYNGKKVGEEYAYLIGATEENKFRIGKIKGVGTKSFIILNHKGSIKKIKYAQ